MANRNVEEATERAISAGYRHIDSAYVYQNEEEVGRALQKKMADGTVTRNDLFFTTKVLCVRPWLPLSEAPVLAQPKLVGCQTSSQGAGWGPAGRDVAPVVRAPTSESCYMCDLGLRPTKPQAVKCR